MERIVQVPGWSPHYYNTNILTDINESNGGCSHNCTNTEKSFECSCRDGYMLDSDGKNCSGSQSTLILMKL